MTTNLRHGLYFFGSKTTTVMPELPWCGGNDVHAKITIVAERKTWMQKNMDG
jgi:hypothetical protein